MSVAWVGVAASVAGSVMNAGAAGDVADGQAQSAANQTALDTRIYNENTARQQPFYDTGLAANNRLSQLMGLGGGSSKKTADQIRAELLGQYTSTGGGSGAGNPANVSNAANQGGLVAQSPMFAHIGGSFQPGPDGEDVWVPTGAGQSGGSTVDESGLTAAINARLAEQDRAEQAAMADPSYGSLTRNFTASDMASDPIYAQQSGLVDSAIQRASNFETAPGYEFRLAEGAKGVENSAAARGMQLSGANLKGLTQYNQNFASNEYDNWFNQSNTDRNYVSGQGNDAFNRFNTNNTTQYNRLAGLSGAAQQAAGSIDSTAANYAKSVGSNSAVAANANAAGIVGSANALSQGVSGAINGYQNNQLLNYIRQPQTSFGVPSVMDGGYSVGQGSAYGGNRAGL
jgi:hypothetical protein